MTPNVPTPARLMRLPEVMQLTGYRDSNIYRLMALGQFPKNVKLGARSSAWVASEIEHWIAERITARDQGVAANCSR